jgi:hypothetical protein
MTKTVPTSDELLEQARARLKELEEQESNGDELGDRVELAPGDYFIGRWRGEGQMHTKGGDAFDVYLFWDVDDRHRFHYRNAALVSEVDESSPGVGDEIVIVRGEDVDFESQGEKRTMHRYAVRVRPSPDPLPGGAAEPASPAAEPADDELPF